MNQGAAGSPPGTNPNRFGVGEAALYFLIAAAIDVAVGARSLPALLQGGLVNPDSYMRLDRLRDILALHAPLSVVLRDASGAGGLVIWSHLLDAIMLVLALPLRPFMGADAALHVVAAAMGPLGMGALGTACAWAMAPLSDRAWRWTAPVLVGVAPPIVSYGIPGVAHHHVLLALAMLMMAALAGRIAAGPPYGDRVPAGWALAAWGVFGIWLSPEAMPFLLMALGGAGLAWALWPGQREIGRALAACGSVLAVLMTAAFLVDPPNVGLRSTEIDRLSVVYVVLGAAVGLAGWALWGVDRMRLSPVRRAALGMMAALAGLAAWLVVFPNVLRGPDGMMDPETTRAIFGDIQEMQPIRTLTEGAVFLLDGGVAALLLAWLAANARPRPVAAMWGYATLCTLAMLVLGMQHVRFATYATVVAAAALPVALSECNRRLAARPGAQAIARVSLLAVVMLANRADAARPLFETSTASLVDAADDCPVDGLGPMLAPFAGQVVLTNVNQAPELLYRTGIKTVGSLYTRNINAFLRLRAAWRSGPSQGVPEAIQAAGINAVLICPRASRSALVSDLPEDTLLDRLARGEVPAWLRQSAVDPVSGYVIYVVTGDGTASR